MKEPDGELPTSATSDSIPRAVEFLINWLLRWCCFAMAGAFGLLALVALMQSWTWWILMPALAIFWLSFVCGAMIRPKGKLVFDRCGPSVIVPVANSVIPLAADERIHQQQE